MEISKRDITQTNFSQYVNHRRMNKKKMEGSAAGLNVLPLTYLTFCC